MKVPHVDGLLSADAVAETAAAIAAVQRPDGSIPWHPGAVADPWNHTEAAMALTVGGRRREAERAYGWLQRVQRPDGSWASAYRDGMEVDPTFNTNYSAYPATGVWHHYLATSDRSFLEAMWPMVDRAMEAVLDLQSTDGEIWWARDHAGNVWPDALLTGCSSIYLSLRCAIAIAEHLGSERPDWELSAGLLAHAVAHRPQAFMPLDRFSMDWYYPVLAGALEGDSATLRIDERWELFVVPRLGVRCVLDRPWVTTAESAELVVALASTGRCRDAETVLRWIQRMRCPDGAYVTGYVFADDAFWPEERPTWTSGAVVLAADALCGANATSGLFRGVDLPVGVRPEDPITERP